MEKILDSAGRCWGGESSWQRWSPLAPRRWFAHRVYAAVLTGPPGRPFFGAFSPGFQTSIGRPCSDVTRASDATRSPLNLRFSPQTCLALHFSCEAVRASQRVAQRANQGPLRHTSSPLSFTVKWPPRSCQCRPQRVSRPCPPTAN